MWFKYDRELCGLFTHKSVPVIFEPPFIYVRKVKIKVTLVQALRFCTGRTAHRGSRGIALPFHDHGTRKKPLFILGKDPVPIVQEAEWASEPVWTVGENLAPTEIRNYFCPGRSLVVIPTALPGPHTYT